jgi:hypothetical protein
MVTFKKMKSNMADHLRLAHPHWPEKFIMEVAHKAAMAMVLHDRELEKELLSSEKNGVHKS